MNPVFSLTTNQQKVEIVEVRDRDRNFCLVAYIEVETMLMPLIQDHNLTAKDLMQNDLGGMNGAFAVAAAFWYLAEFYRKAART